MQCLLYAHRKAGISFIPPNINERTSIWCHCQDCDAPIPISTHDESKKGEVFQSLYTRGVHDDVLAWWKKVKSGHSQFLKSFWTNNDHPASSTVQTRSAEQRVPPFWYIQHQLRLFFIGCVKYEFRGFSFPKLVFCLPYRWYKWGKNEFLVSRMCLLTSFWYCQFEYILNTISNYYHVEVKIAEPLMPWNCWECH